jgi:tetrahedral aminopeptidase
MSEPENPNDQAPGIGAEQIVLLERLSNACAVSGNEGEVRAIVLEQIKPFANEIKIDAMGNVLATCRAKVDRPLRVMLAAHMDEVGLMLVEEDDGGLYRFAVVGGIDVRQLPGKPVWVGKHHVPGIIGAKAIHLTTPEERRITIPIESLRIDLGTGGAGKASIGDWASYATSFQQIGPSLSGKALDNRLGVATLIELVKHAPDQIELLAAFTVQEEVGLRGARIAAYAFNPDLGIAIDATPAYDQPMWDDSENSKYNTHLDAGPAIYLADSSTISDPRLVRHMLKTAEALGIPFQVRQPGGGGTDAGAIHSQRAGIPSITVSVPVRYAHSARLLARRSDWQHTFTLLHAALNTMQPGILEPI